MDKWIEQKRSECREQISTWRDGWMDGRLGGWVYEWINRTEEGQ